jgi:hypothetical protein
VILGDLAVSNKQALLDLQVFKVASLSGDWIDTANVSDSWAFQMRRAKNLEALHGDMARLELHSIADAAKRVGTPANPIGRKGHRVNQHRHAPRSPSGVVRKNFGSN